MEKIIRELEELCSRYKELEGKNTALEDKNTVLEGKNTKLSRLVRYYEERFRLSQHRMFAVSSEKSADEGRQTILIFDEAENEAAPRNPKPAAEEITYTRRRRTSTDSNVKDDIESLPAREVIHSVPEERHTCSVCYGPKHVMGHETIRRKLEIIPARVCVVKHTREVYSCRGCERENTTASS